MRAITKSLSARTTGFRCTRQCLPGISKLTSRLTGVDMQRYMRENVRESRGKMGDQQGGVEGSLPVGR